MFKPADLPRVLILAAFVFLTDALGVNVVFLSWFVGAFLVMVGLPLLFLMTEGRRLRLRNIAILAAAIVAAVVLVNVNARVAPSRADRLVRAVENYRAEVGVYPKKLDDLVPKFIDRVPCAQYTLGGDFHYLRGGTTDPPMLWYNPHQMDHRGYQFDEKRWWYLD